MKNKDWDKFVKENHTNFSSDANGIKYEFYEDDLLEFIYPKPKELNWEKRIKFIDIGYDGDYVEIDGEYVSSEKELKDFIQSLLTQQRTELLEEIKKYNELIMVVETKFEGETRHQTALRYIKHMELGNPMPQSINNLFNKEKKI